MPSYDRDEAVFECPKCGKPIETTNYDIYGRRRIQCRNYSCKAVIEFDMSSTGRFRAALDEKFKIKARYEKDMATVEQKIEKSLMEAVAKAKY